MSTSHRRSASQPQIHPVPAPAQPPPPVTSNVEVLAGVRTLIEFVNTVPSPLTAVLIGLSPTILRVRRAIEIASWKSSWEESWLVIAAWWGLCLFADFSARYLLPVIALGFIAVSRRRNAALPSKTPPITEQHLQLAISDLSTIFSLLPSVPQSPATPFPILIRVTAILYVPYVVLTWRAPWSRIIRTTLWRSAWVRWSVYRAWSILSGTHLPGRLEPYLQTSNVETAPVNTIRFLFTIYENQRWWVGLDWTAALLPGERPSWCSATQQPVPPPSAFSLPPPTVAFIGDGKGGRVKRVAMWTWDDNEWRVTVHKEGEGPSRVEKPIPALKEEIAGSTRLFKAANKMMEASSSGSAATTPISPTASKGPTGKGGEEQAHGDAEPEKQEDVDEVTDVDGWVFGDNKWETRSAKGGMGKYTRYRRWSRVAVLTEMIEPVGPGETGVLRDDGELHPLPTPLARVKEEEEKEVKPAPKEPNIEVVPRAASPDDSRGGLKKRLQAAVSSHH
ncbi:hypothetical protein EVG20_g8293 [Dentipellis fragilis]|uniref:Peroxin/Ferlin domain-containing protein n=1 Tax=Dentipellis fragilis TaxID=205917 RepID=A0A4Y9Y9D7_9AGAM|nr:hypothetical protein EVG20_g8293 [Dentipellis fragilis]